MADELVRARWGRCYGCGTIGNRHPLRYCQPNGVWDTRFPECRDCRTAQRSMLAALGCTNIHVPALSESW